MKTTVVKMRPLSEWPESHVRVAREAGNEPPVEEVLIPIFVGVDNKASQAVLDVCDGPFFRRADEPWRVVCPHIAEID